MDYVNHIRDAETQKTNNMKKSMQLTIYGEPGSKSNSRRITRFGKHPRLIKSDKALKYEVVAFEQLETLLESHEPFEEPVRLTVDIYFASRRPDLDVALIQDILQKRVHRKTGKLICKGVYLNDRQVKEIIARKFLDKENPRSEILVEVLED